MDIAVKKNGTDKAGNALYAVHREIRVNTKNETIEHYYHFEYRDSEGSVVGEPFNVKSINLTPEQVSQWLTQVIVDATTDTLADEINPQE